MLPPGLRALLEALEGFAEAARAAGVVRAALLRRAGPAQPPFLAALLDDLAELEEKFSRAALKVNDSVRRALGK